MSVLNNAKIVISYYNNMFFLYPYLGIFTIYVPEINKKRLAEM